MTTSETALLISGISVVIAFSALIWNVYRDILLKPKLKVRFSINIIVDPKLEINEMNEELIISGTNFGPGAMYVKAIHAKKISVQDYLWSEEENFYVHPDHRNPLSDILPKRLEVGESISIHLPYDRSCFLNSDITHIGLANSLAKTFWAPKSDVIEAKNHWINDFGRHEKAKG